MPPKAAAEVAVAALVVLPELEELPELPLFELLLHPAANIRPLTAMAAAATVLLLGTSVPLRPASAPARTAPRWRRRGDRRGST